MVDKSWNFQESLFFINSVKDKYKGFMTSFCVFGGNKEYFEKVYNLKKEIYELSFEEWRKDKLWEYLNDDISYVDLWRFV